MLEIALALVPLLMLLVSLLLGHYPGIEAMSRLSERLFLRSRPRRAGSQALPTGRRSRSVAAGLLIAFGLAQRPPPLPAWSD